MECFVATVCGRSHALAEPDEEIADIDEEWGKIHQCCVLSTMQLKNTWQQEKTANRLDLNRETRTSMQNDSKSWYLYIADELEMAAKNNNMREVDKKKQTF